MIPDLDRLISQRERELAQLYAERRERDQARLLLAILKVADKWFKHKAGWFTAKELVTLAALEPALDDSNEGNGLLSMAALRRLQGKSPKAIGRLLLTIADDQDRAGSIPAVRLLRHKDTTKPTVWKVQTYPPACGANGHGR